MRIKKHYWRRLEILLVTLQLCYSTAISQQIILPQFLTLWGGAGYEDGQLRYQDKIDVDSDGYVYVADSDNYRIQKFTSDGTFVTKWSTDYQPHGIAVDNHGFIYVTYGTSILTKYTSAGVLVSEWVGAFTKGVAIAADHSGFLYVADANGSFDAIYKYTSNGMLVKKWDRSDGHLNYPTAVDVDNAGFVYVSDLYAEVNGSVIKYTDNGDYVTSWWSHVYTGDITIDYRGLVYVTDNYDHKVRIFTSDGLFIAEFGEWAYPDALPGQFMYIAGVAIDESGYIYVSDASQRNFNPKTDRIQKFTRIEISAPTLSSLSQNSATPGGPEFTLTVHGYNFMDGATVLWDGSARPTTYVSSTEINATIPPEDIAVAKSVLISARNPGSATSNILQFVVGGVVPVLTSLTPSNTTAGGAGFVLTVNGTNFSNGATVMWDGSDRPTIFISSTQLRATINEADISSAKTVSVTARNVGSADSNALSFSINYSAPMLTSVFPTSAVAGDPAFILSVRGTGFVNGATVMWDGSNRTTSYVSSTELTTNIGATDIATARTVQITARNPGSSTSNSIGFAVINPIPSLTSLVPSSAVAGSQGFTLAVIGSRFANGAIVRWDGNDRATVFVNSNEVDASITANDILNAKTVYITVRNPDGGTSGALNFSINSPAAPVLTSISPSRVTGGGAAFTLNLNGSNFVSGSVVNWNGSSRITTFISSTQLQAAILAGDIGAGGDNQVTVTNPVPAGSASNALTFSVSSFSLSSSTSIATVNAGQSATYTIQITPNHGSFDSPVSFRCTGLPIYTTASISPSLVTPGLNPVSATLTISTTSSSASILSAIFKIREGNAPALLFLPAFLGLLLVISSRSSIAWSLRRLQIATGLVVMIAFIGSCTGPDSDPSPDKHRTPAGTYNLIVEGEAGTLKSSTTVTLTVR